MHTLPRVARACTHCRVGLGGVPPPRPTRQCVDFDVIPYKSNYENPSYTRRDEEDRAAGRGGSQFPLKRRGTLAGELQPIPINPLIDPPPITCFNCWQEGHRVRQCPRPVTRSYCRNCGRSGVEERTCPRCSQLFEAHQAELRDRRSRTDNRADSSRERSHDVPRGRSRSNVREYQAPRRGRNSDQVCRQEDQREQERREQERREHERRCDAEQARRETLFHEESRLREMQHAR